MPDQPEIPCPGAVLKRAHDAHYWRPERSMGPVHCPGVHHPEPGAWFPTGVVLAPGDEEGPWPACNDYKQATDHATEDPLAPFRALANQYAAKTAESRRNAAASTLDEARAALPGVAAGWEGAEFLLRHTLADLDNSRTTPDNHPASDDLRTQYAEAIGSAWATSAVIHGSSPRAREDITGAVLGVRDAELDRLGARIVTLEHVAAGNKRHVQLIVPELERAAAAVARVRALHVRNANSGTCEHCSARDYPDYAVPHPCPTIAALKPPEETPS